MKLICLAFIALCVYAQGAVVSDNIGDTEIHTGPIEYSLKKSSENAIDEVAESRIAAALAQVEYLPESRFIGNAIANALENFRPIVVNGNDDLPPLDPLVIPLIGPFKYTTLGTRITGSVNNFQLEGLRWYVVDHVNVNALRLTLSLQVTVPWLTCTGSYDASASILLLSHTAGGNYRVFVNRIEVAVDTRLGASLFGGRLFLRELDINLMIHDVSIRIEGMVGSNTLNSIINSAVQSAAQNLLRNELDAISRMLSDELFDTINELLGNFTLDDLLG